MLQHCNETFTTITEADKHIQRNNCYKEVGSKKIKIDVNCDQCHQKFKTRREMKRHFLKNHAIETYKCPICGIMFKRTEEWRRHQEYTHDDDVTLYSCSKCNYKSKKKHNVKMHERAVHFNKEQEEESNEDALELRDPPLLHFTSGVEGNEVIVANNIQVKHYKCNRGEKIQNKSSIN